MIHTNREILKDAHKDSVFCAKFARLKYGPLTKRTKRGRLVQVGCK